MAVPESRRGFMVGGEEDLVGLAQSQERFLPRGVEERKRRSLLSLQAPLGVLAENGADTPDREALLLPEETRREGTHRLKR